MRSLLIVLTLASLANSAPAAPPQCRELFQPARIEIANPRLGKNEFAIQRSLTDYEKHYKFRTSSILSMVKNLRPGSVWIDMGAGEGRAIEEGLKLNPLIDPVAIGFAKPENARTGFTYLHGDYVENMNADGKLDHFKGHTSLITDTFGPISYSENVPAIFQTYLDLLRPGGQLVFNIMVSRGHDARGEGVFNNSEKMNVGLLDWIQTIPGIEILDAGHLSAKTRTVLENSVSIRLKKVARDVEVPRTLKTVRYEAGGPPQRIFSR